MRDETGTRRTHRRGADSPASVWKEKESLDGKIVEAGVIILQTTGCSHSHRGGCSMCGYNIGSSGTIAPKDISKQFTRAIEELGKVDLLKVYTSGSFLDECEIPVEQADQILRHCADNHTRLLFESRPEYVTPETLDRVLRTHDHIELALGLESANGKVLIYSINKGFTVKDYDDAVQVLTDKRVDIRTYVLLKPPFLTEAEAVADAKATMIHAAKNSKTVSLNPVNVQKGTLVERLWKNWAYRPPWLWSVLDVLKASKDSGKKIICDPTGGGKERGAHNCGKCDDVILDSIKGYSQTQDASRLGAPECDCREIWRSVMDLEGFVMGGTCDLQRFFRKHGA
ncbi:MAG: archaeosine biosynthesis radical SAM protein RaSEA [Thermoplasmatota archaeon]|nr:archaeosine biosynthesis radical SAM protein RaSEA [Candidatus Thermoplasmatota archaeon]MBU1623386.1 archaeosine biosynthesis radical SAM protein RaSEA [Nanoarchaeota archaeon]MBU1913890.1 archaeosine biosynthesis radical SAM protein RaSEA [Candidatus Thermoplasmatota archaeon]